MEENYIAVVGAMNIDIIGTSYEQLTLSDSNQGKINITYGGVGRNIAENLCRLGIKTELITVLGDDVYSEDFIVDAERLGLGFSHSLRLTGQNTSIYVSINNNDGDMTLAVNDMKLYDLMTVDFIASQMEFINQSSMLIFDTNIPQDVITYMTEKCTVPMIADPVSIKKSLKLVNVLPRLYSLKPNIFEAEGLTRMKIENLEDVKKVANYLYSCGIKKVFVSLGEDGVYYVDESTEGQVKCFGGEVVDTTGCGDAFIAAIAWAFAKGLDIRQVATAGVAAAAVCASATGTISKELTDEKLCKMLEIE